MFTTRRPGTKSHVGFFYSDFRVIFPASLFIVVYGPFSLAVRRIANDVNHNPTDTSNDGEDVNEGWDDRRAEVMGRRAMVGTCARRVGMTMVGTNAKENERKQDSSRGNDW